MALSWWHQINRRLASQKPVAWLAARTMHHIDPFVYKVSGSRTTAAGFFTGLPIVQVTTRGAKSGRLRTVPLLAIPHGEQIILIASNWGGERNPAWYYNLRRNPQAQLFIQGERRSYVARELSGDEREALWQKAVAAYGGYEAYRDRTGGREIPVMLLSPTAEPV